MSKYEVGDREGSEIRKEKRESQEKGVRKERNTLPVVTKASDTLLLRPAVHVAMRSAMPQLSSRVVY